MSDDLISRQSTIQVLDNAAEQWNIAEPYHEGMRAGYRNSARLILSLPSAEPEVTEEAVKDYCRKRGLTILTNDYFHKLTSAQPDYTELKQEFLRMASYIDVLLECSDEQKETLIGFISRLSEHMPWTEKD